MTKDPVRINKKKSSARVSHGGSCYINSDNLVVNWRGSTSPGYRDSNIGLRLVRNTKEK